MNIIKAPKRITMDEAAKLLGLKTYDVALPQQWLDEIVLFITNMKNHIPELKDVPEDVYGFILSGVVWCYDNSFLGYPVALIKPVYDCLLFKSLKDSEKIYKYRIIEAVQFVMIHQQAVLELGGI